MWQVAGRFVGTKTLFKNPVYETRLSVIGARFEASLPPPPPPLLFRHLWKLCCFVDIIDTGKSTGSPFFKRENYAQVKWEMRSRRKIIEDIPDNWNEINFPDNEINLCFATIGRPSSQVARLHTFFQINEERIISRYVYIYPRPWKNTANIEIEIEIVPYARWINDENKLCFIKRKREKKKSLIFSAIIIRIYIYIYNSFVKIK